MPQDIKIQIDFTNLEALKSTQIDLLHILQRANDSEVQISGSGYDTLCLLEQLTERMFEFAEAGVSKNRNLKTVAS